MKKILKILVLAFLGFAARGVIARYKPRIVMVTGSVGKTSTKDAVAAVLMTRYLVRKSLKNLNTEFGVPFTILGVGDPFRNLFAWLGILKRALALLILPNHYPNMLVLEVGADKPGDMEQILRMATPEAVVVTYLPEIPVHVEAYTSPEQVREEEFSPAYALPVGAPLIVSAEDTYALESAVRLAVRVITYGFSERASVRLSDPGFHEKNAFIVGMRANVKTKEEQRSLIVKGSVGITQILPLAAAIAVGSAFDISLSEATKAFDQYEAPPGRGRLFAGVRSSIIIDDTYNSSPIAVEEAIKTLKAFPVPRSGRRILVLGDMLELGRYSATEHERIGALGSDVADLFVAVGIRARAFIATRGKADVLQYDSSASAAKDLPSLIQSGDVVLVKGSQSIRTERIVEALLADPSDASRLVRQEEEWLKKV